MEDTLCASSNQEDAILMEVNVNNLTKEEATHGFNYNLSNINNNSVINSSSSLLSAVPFSSSLFSSFDTPKLDSNNLEGPKLVN